SSELEAEFVAIATPKDLNNILKIPLDSIRLFLEYYRFKKECQCVATHAGWLKAPDLKSDGSL
ncbi:hypothetical protein, partial [Acinetobacter indicus]|uniref:hypothetical protein n=1 Tax=Acinetobacter indicus TaxID=756892 RepID=UPI0039896512